MKKQTLLLFAGSLLFLTSCAIHTDSFRTTAGLINGDSTVHIVSLIMTDGNKVEFGDWGGFYSPSNRQVTGESEHGLATTVPVSKIQSCVISRVSFWWTFLAYGLGIPLVLAFIFLTGPGFGRWQL